MNSAMFEICAKTDVGQKRTTNEDSWLSVRVGDAWLVAVADGLGGHAAGEVASKIALTELAESMKEWEKQADMRQALERAIAKANTEIFRLSEENSSFRGMGTTLVVAVLIDKRVLIANVGDSRAYWVRADRIEQITRDHSLVQELLDRQTISKEEAFNHPQKNIVTRTLGTQSQLIPDLYDDRLSEQLLLLCSDGLTDSLSDQDILDTVVHSSNIDDACTRLIDAANAKGGRDNITLVLVKKPGPFLLVN